jgi:hypothetical protein
LSWRYFMAKNEGLFQCAEAPTIAIVLTDPRMSLRY